MDRAYSTFTLKNIDEEKRTFAGWATTPARDRVGDIIDPLGVRYANPLVLLFQHDHKSPIGRAVFDKPTAAGVRFNATIPRINEAGILKDRTDEAWQSVKAQVIRAVSIGFRPIDYTPMKDGGTRFREIEVIELSAVSVPANQTCTIDTIKAYDVAARHTDHIVSLTPQDYERAKRPLPVVKLWGPGW